MKWYHQGTISILMKEIDNLEALWVEWRIKLCQEPGKDSELHVNTMTDNNIQQILNIL